MLGNVKNKNGISSIIIIYDHNAETQAKTVKE